MSEIKKLKDVLKRLQHTILEFPVGAVTLEDLIPIEKTITSTQDAIKCLNARLLVLRAKSESGSTKYLNPEDNRERIIEKLSNATVDVITNNQVMKLCVHSKLINEKFEEEENSPTGESIRKITLKLFTLNENMISLHESLQKKIQEHLTLKAEYRREIYEHNNFLKEQREESNTNEDDSETTEKSMTTLKKINLMKRLITHFIATSNNMIPTTPLMRDMLKEHRKFISFNDITDMVQNSSES